MKLKEEGVVAKQNFMKLSRSYMESKLVSDKFGYRVRDFVVKY